MCVCVMDYYAAIKKNEILPFVAIWMDLEDIMLSEVSQAEKDKHVMYLTTEGRGTLLLAFLLCTCGGMHLPRVPLFYLHKSNV